MKILTAPQSGSQAGTTASRNRFGQYLRTRAIPVQPRTPKQTGVRALMAIGSSAWRSQTAPVQTAWNDYAAQISRSDSLGSSYSPTGAELFTGAVIALGEPAIEDPPSVLPNYFLQVTAVNYTDPTPGPEELAFVSAATSADNFVLVETSGPISPGITSAAAVRKWFSLPQSSSNLAAQRFTFTTNPTTILVAYNYLFPSILSGQVIFFRFSEIFYDTVSGAGVRNKLRQTSRLVVP